LDNAHMIDNEEYFIKFMSPIIVNAFYNHWISIDSNTAQEINKFATQEYLYELNNIK
jgi:hypothetical protein